MELSEILSQETSSITLSRSGSRFLEKILSEEKSCFKVEEFSEIRKINFGKPFISVLLLPAKPIGLHDFNYLEKLFWRGVIQQDFELLVDFIVWKKYFLLHQKINLLWLYDHTQQFADWFSWVF